MESKLGGESPLGLTLACEEASRAPQRSSAAEELVQVRFEFPDGSVAESDFKRGQTVEVLKAFLAAEFDMPMEEVGLEHDGRIMLDPLSLADVYHHPEDVMDVYVLVDSERYCRESKGKK